MNLAKLTHANLNEPLIVDLDLLGLWYYSPGHKATVVMLTGGGMAPVKEDVETINELKKGKKKNARQSP